MKMLKECTDECVNFHIYLEYCNDSGFRGICSKYDEDTSTDDYCKEESYNEKEI